MLLARFKKFYEGSRRLEKAIDRRLNKAQEGSRRFQKVPEDSSRLRKFQRFQEVSEGTKKGLEGSEGSEGSKRFNNVLEDTRRFKQVSRSYRRY